MRDQICAKAPLSPILNHCAECKDKWITVLAKGGDLVVDCVLVDGFTDHSEVRLWDEEN